MCHASREHIIQSVARISVTFAPNMIAKSLLRSVAPAARSARLFSTSRYILAEKPKTESTSFEGIEGYGVSRTLADVTGPNKLFGPGTESPDAMPTAFDISTGLERLELLAKMEGVELFDTQPLIQDRKGTMDDPFIVDSLDPVRYIGCTGFPQGSQEVNWIRLEAGKLHRDWESGCVYKLNYIGPNDRF